MVPIGNDVETMNEQMLLRPGPGYETGGRRKSRSSVSLESANKGPACLDGKRYRRRRTLRVRHARLANRIMATHGMIKVDTSGHEK